MGLEPTIFCSVGRRVIHYATRLIVTTLFYYAPKCTATQQMFVDYRNSHEIFLVANLILKKTIDNQVGDIVTIDENLIR